MSAISPVSYRIPFSGWRKLAILFFLPAALVSWAAGQTTSSGALMVVVLDPSGAVITGASVHLTKADGPEELSATTDGSGRVGFSLLSPGTYDLGVSKPQFKSVSRPDIHIRVTETLRLELRLDLPTRSETSQVTSEPAMIQLDTSALGRIVNEKTVAGLPLVTRNFAQIADLSPGVVAGVNNAGELGIGGTALSQIGTSNDGIYAHGARSYDNNWQLDGISVSDVEGAGSISGGIPIPSPDMLEEFKVQTGLYDAAFGRAAGANVSVITKTGTNQYHGSIFEFVRNDVLNANDFFLNETGQRRPNFKQHQFGLALGGPIRKDKLVFFGSYQGTRQINGTASGQSRIACTASLYEPPLTNDRSPSSLGSLFGGLKGALGGVAINPDGSNINPAALSLLNFKLPDGSFLIPTPQIVDASRPFSSIGFSTFTEPCHFEEDQGSGNLDYVMSQKSQLAARFFIADDDQRFTFPGGA